MHLQTFALRLKDEPQQLQQPTVFIQFRNQTLTVTSLAILLLFYNLIWI